MDSKDTAANLLDITGLVCPMTFVRTKLALERLSPGEVLEVRLNAGESLANVPRSLIEHGHEVLQVVSETPGTDAGTYRLWVRRV